MNTKHTPGPWTYRDNGEFMPIVVRGMEGGFVVKGTTIENANADARLIAAAPFGVEAAAIAYSALLSHPHDEWRARNQAAYAYLRDFIAQATGRTSEEVQNEYEATAANE